MRYHYSEDFNATLLPHSWFYFSTTHPIDPKIPLKFRVRSNGPVKIAVEDIAVCPNETTIPILVTQGGISRWYDVTTEKKFKLNMVAVGVFSEESQVLYVTLPVKKRMRSGTRIALRIGGVFFGMATVSILVFWFCILPGPKRKLD
jgi:hypothetical protein